MYKDKPREREKQERTLELEKKLVKELWPLLVAGKQKVDRRLVTTLLGLVMAILIHRRRNHGLLLSELGGYLLEPEYCQAGAKRIRNSTAQPEVGGDHHRRISMVAGPVEGTSFFDGSSKMTFLERYGSWGIVAGASLGLGAEFACQLAARGLNLVLVARRMDLLKSLSAELSSKYRIRTKCLELDLSDVDAAEQIIRQTMHLDVGRWSITRPIRQWVLFWNSPWMPTCGQSTPMSTRP